MVTLPDSLASLVAQAEARLGVRFAHPELLIEALTHRSSLNEPAPDLLTPSNERLEFLGDAVLGFIIARHVYLSDPDLSEGQLTSRRSALIRASTLAEWAREFDLASLLRLGQGEMVGGEVRDSILADAFEAILAAILLDRGLPAVEDFLRPLLARPSDEVLRRHVTQNYKGKLQEVAQEREHLTPVYRTVAIEGPDHENIFTVEVVIGERGLARGVGRSKQAAQQAAARLGLERYRAEADEA